MMQPERILVGEETRPRGLVLEVLSVIGRDAIDRITIGRDAIARKASGHAGIGPMASGHEGIGPMANGPEVRDRIDPIGRTGRKASVRN